MVKLYALPPDGRPVSIFTNRAEAFVDIAQGIKIVVDKLRQSEPQDHRQTGFKKILFSDEISYENITLPNNSKTIPTITGQGKFKKDAITKNITADIPIQNLHEDQLGFDIYTLAFGEFT